MHLDRVLPEALLLRRLDPPLLALWVDDAVHAVRGGGKEARTRADERGRGVVGVAQQRGHLDLRGEGAE
eukprot:180978-Chlamydomonas_euryale.AAC.1